jgi:hypothetical protein
MRSRIIIWNLTNNGDLLAAQPIVDRIIGMNKHKTFEIFILYNYFLYPNIKPFAKPIENYISHPNALHAGVYSHCIGDLETRRGHSFFLPHNNLPFIKLDENTHAINTHCCAYDRYIEGTTELNIQKFFKAFSLGIADFNKTFGQDLAFEESPALPIISRVNTSGFDAWKSKQTKKILFYYNFTPKSGQAFPDMDHMDAVRFIAEGEVAVITPFGTPFSQGCEEWGIYPTPTCENLAQYYRISLECDFVFSFDTGACFYWLCDEEVKGKWIHCGVEYYYERIAQSIKDVRGSGPTVSFSHVSNLEDMKSIVKDKVFKT